MQKFKRNLFKFTVSQSEWFYLTLRVTLIRLKKKRFTLKWHQILCFLVWTAISASSCSSGAGFWGGLHQLCAILKSHRLVEYCGSPLSHCPTVPCCCFMSERLTCPHMTSGNTQKPRKNSGSRIELGPLSHLLSKDDISSHEWVVNVLCNSSSGS